MRNGIKTSIHLPKKTIASLLCSAFEGGSNYWYEITDSRAPKRYTFRTDAERIYSHIDYPLNLGGLLTIRTLENDTINGKQTWTLGLGDIERGLHIMASKYPAHFADVLSENDDASTGDVFLQCCLFGEVIFG